MHLYTFLRAVATCIDRRIGKTFCRDHVDFTSMYLDRVRSPFDLHAAITMSLSVISNRSSLPRPATEALLAASDTVSARKIALIFLCVPMGDVRNGAWPKERYAENGERSGNTVRESFYTFISAAVHQTVSVKLPTVAAVDVPNDTRQDQLRAVLRWGAAMRSPANIRELEAALANMPDAEKQRFMDLMLNGMTEQEINVPSAFAMRVTACRSALHARPLN